MKLYKAHNKRMIFRGSNGQFRKTTLMDLGAGCCQTCGCFYELDFNDAKVGGFIDPFLAAKIKTHCRQCR